VGQVTIDESDS